MTKIFGRQGNKKRTYTEKEKMEILATLRDNGYDYMKTSKETGVAYNSLTNWNNKYSDKLGHTDISIAIAKKTELEVSKMKEDFLQQHFNELNSLTEKAIWKAIALIDDEVDLNKINNSIKVIGDLLAKLATVEGQKEASAPINLIQQSITMMNQIYKNND